MQWLPPARVVRLAALALAVLLLPARPAACAAAPDSATFARLNTIAMSQNRFRVTTAGGRCVMTSLRMDREGVDIQLGPVPPALFVTAEARSASTKHAAWSEIDRIEVTRSQSLRGAVICGLIGGLVGLAAKQAFEGDLHDASSVAIVAIPIGAVLGGAIGAMAGSAGHWRRLYP